MFSIEGFIWLLVSPLLLAIAVLWLMSLFENSIETKEVDRRRNLRRFIGKAAGTRKIKPRDKPSEH
jgi:hypothetical protein